MRKHLILIACLTVTSCADDYKLPLIYRIDINQGNIFTQDMVNQLKPGMTKRQVAFVMGNPLVEDDFHKNRWDYIYSNEPGDEARVEKKLTVIFHNDQLTGIQGDLRPTSAPANDGKKDVTYTIPKIQRDKTLWEMITGVFGD